MHEVSTLPVYLPSDERAHQEFDDPTGLTVDIDDDHENHREPTSKQYGLDDELHEFDELSDSSSDRESIERMIELTHALSSIDARLAARVRTGLEELLHEEQLSPLEREGRNTNNRSEERKVAKRSRRIGRRRATYDFIVL